MPILMEIKEGSKLTLVTEEAVIICSVISVRSRGGCCSGPDPCEPLVVQAGVGVDPAVTGADKTVTPTSPHKAIKVTAPATPTQLVELCIKPVSSHSRQASRR